jgi:quinolinate synthase
MIDMKVISHNYQVGATQEISDFVYGTTGIVRKAARFSGEQLLFCGVLYMAEDLYTMSDGKAEVFIPEVAVKDGEVVHPRCPMIRKQHGRRMAKTDVVESKMVEQARAMDVDMVLAYINTPISLKGMTDGVYNGTLALKVIDELASKKSGRGSVALIGDENVNGWIADVAAKSHPDFKVISVPAAGVCCPSHLSIPTDMFIETYNELVSEYGEAAVGLEMHAEVDAELRKFGFEHNAYFGGTGGLVDNVKNSELDVWLVGTVEGVVDRLRRETDKDIFSLNMVCPNMAFTSPPKVQRAKEILSNGGPAAEIRFTNESAPYYEIEILNEELIRHQTLKSTGEKNPEGFSFIPAARLTVDKRFMAPGKKALEFLV